MTASSSISDPALKWYEQVDVAPAKRLTLMAGDHGKVYLFNRCHRQVTYKIKTTRYESVLPNRTYGLINHNEKVCVKIAYKPTKKEKLFDKHDRITFVMQVLPDQNVVNKPEQLWKDNIHRHVLRLVPHPLDVQKQQKRDETARQKRKRPAKTVEQQPAVGRRNRQTQPMKNAVV